MRNRCLLVLLAAVLASPAWAAFPVPESTAFPISTSGYDRSPSVATDGQGNSVVVWTRLALSRTQVVARRFSPQGNPLGGLLQVASNGTLPKIAMNAHGDFVVGWLDASAPRPGNGSPLRVQLFTPTGARVGRTTQLTTPVEAQSGLPSIGVDQSGAFAVSWSSSSGVFLRRFDPKGAPLGATVLVDGNGLASSLAMRPDGSFTLVWHAASLLGRGYGADGQAEGADFQINQLAVNNSQNLSVSATQDGGIVAAWDVCGTAVHSASAAVGSPVPSPRPSPGVQTCDIRARRFDAGNQPLTDELAVSPADGRSNMIPVVAAEDGRGFFAISWRSCLSPTSCQISTQLYSPQTVPSSRVSTVSIGVDATSPAVAASPTGFVVAFSSAVCTNFFPGCRRNTPRGIYGWRFDFP